MTTPTSYTPTTWVNGSLGNTPLNADNLNKLETGLVNAYILARVGSTSWVNQTKTTTYNPNIGEFVLYSCATNNANITNTLPKSTVGARIKLKKTDSTAYQVIFNTSGGDTIDLTNNSITLRLIGETRTLVGIVGGWLVDNGVNTIQSLDSRYGNRIDSILGASYNTPIVCETRLSTQIASGATGNILLGTTGWTVMTDPYSMWTANGDTYRITLPLAGRYQCEFHLFQGTTNTAGVIQTHVLKNRPNSTAVATSVSTYSIFSQSMTQLSDTDCCSFGNEVFAANDFLTFAYYLNAAATVDTAHFTLSKTKIVVRYLGTV